MTQGDTITTQPNPLDYTQPQPLGLQTPMASPLPQGNPILDEIDQAHASLSPPAKQAIEGAHGILGLKPTMTGAAGEAAAPTPQIAQPGSMMPGPLPEPAGTPASGVPADVPMRGMASLGSDAVSLPGVSGGGPAPRPLGAGETELNRLNREGAPVNHLPMAARIPLSILDALGSGLVPRVAQFIPGTSAHHQQLVGQAGRAAQAEEGQQAAADKSAQEQATTAHTQAQVPLAEAQTREAQARAQSLENPPGKLKDQFETANGGIYNLKDHKWEVEPPEKDKDQLIEVDPEKAKTFGLKPDSEGKYWIPPQAAGELIKTAQPKEPKEGELPLGERVPQINDAMKARYQVLHPGTELPQHYLLPANATQKDFDRTDKLIEGEEKAFGTKENQNQTAELRRQTMALSQQNKGEKEELGVRQATHKAYQPTLDSAERFNVMTKNYEDAIKNHDQQAMLSLLANHLGMTMGLQKGARLTKDIIQEAEHSRPWLQGMGAKFDKNGILSGVTLTPEQMRQMVSLGRERFAEDLMKSRSEAKYMGAKDDGPDRMPNKATMNFYLGQANGDVKKAKEAAATDGWTVK